MLLFKHTATFFWITNSENANNWNMFNCFIDPACQNINTELQCYVLDLNCTAQSNTEASPSQNYVIYIVSILGGLIVSIIFIIFCYKRRRARRNKGWFNIMNKFILFISYMAYCGIYRLIKANVSRNKASKMVKWFVKICLCLKSIAAPNKWANQLWYYPWMKSRGKLFYKKIISCCTFYNNFHTFYKKKKSITRT